MAATTAGISLAGWQIAVAQDREAHANQLFDMSQQIQRSGPCGEFPFLWLTNEKAIAFIDALTNGAYEESGPMLHQYIACFEHQRAVVNIRRMIHSEFPGTEAAYKAAEQGYFTQEDIDEFIALLEVAVTLDKTDARVSDAASPLLTLRTPPATTDGNTLIERNDGRMSAADPSGSALDELDSTRIPRYKPSQPNGPNDETVAALLKSLEREIREADAPRGSPRGPSEEVVASLMQGLEEEMRDSTAAVPYGTATRRASQRDRQPQSDSRPDERQTVQRASALMERARRIRQGRDGNPPPAAQQTVQGASALMERARRIRQGRDGNPPPDEQQTANEVSALMERARRINDGRKSDLNERQRLSFAPPRRENREPNPDEPQVASEIENIRQRILECWVPHVRLRDRQDLTVTIRFGLLRDGSLRSEPTVIEQSRMRSRDFRLAAEAAQGAIQECTPLEGLSAATYEQWREVELAFDPRDLRTPLPASREIGALAVGDEVRVTVFGEEDLSGDFNINAAGWISMPLIGGVAAAGRSVDQLEATIVRALLDGHMKDPRVSVEVLTLQAIFVLGEVNNPGSYPYSAGLTMLKVIALAGGYTNRARTNVLYLIKRDLQQDEQEVRSNVPVFPGDTIFVRERWF